MIDFAAWPAPADTGLEIGQPPSESDVFVRVVGINKIEKLIQAILNRPVITEACFGSPTASAGHITDRASIQIICIYSRIVVIITRNHPIRCSMIVGHSQSAVTCQDNIPSYIKMVVRMDLLLCGGKVANQRIGGGRRIR